MAVGCKKAGLLDDSREHWMDALSAEDLVVLRVVQQVAYLVVRLDEKKVDLVGKMAVARAVWMDQTQAALKVDELASGLEMKWAG